MNKLIKKLLRKSLLKEEMVSMVNSWKNNTSDFDNALSTLIAKDNKNGNKLYLFVVFRPFNNFSEYSYSFMLVDKNNNPLTDYMMLRNEVRKYLPSELIKNKQIFPIIIDLTRQLLNKMTPEEIHRKAIEPLSGDSLKRYDEITNIMVNEFGYKDITDSVSKKRNIWILVKDKHTERNKTMNEEYILGMECYESNAKEMLTELWSKHMVGKNIDAYKK